MHVARKIGAVAAAVACLGAAAAAGPAVAASGHGGGHGGGGGGSSGGSIAASVTRLASDPTSAAGSQHAAVVEPDTFAFGNTVVGAFQEGRFTDGGSSAIGWTRSADHGGTWTSGTLPNLTTAAGGPYPRATDPSVAFDAAHNTWLISSLGLSVSGGSIGGAAVVVSRSTNGGTSWSGPVVVSAASSGEDFDKNWIVCDNTSTSPFYGHCYVTWDDHGSFNLLLNSTSSDGGLTWGAALTTAADDLGIGAQPLVQPNGNVVVPVDDPFEGSIGVYRSTNGGASWGAGVTIGSIRAHTEAGSLRSGPLPTAEMDASGRIFVAWADCRFRRNCKANDIVFMTSTNGQTWSAVTRVPIDSTSSSVDHFLPGLAVDPASSGSTTKLGLVFFYYPSTSCSQSTCLLDAAVVGSLDGGATWTTPKQINTTAMSLSWLPDTTQGRMVGDYMSASWSGGSLVSVTPLAAAPSGSTFDLAAFGVVATVSAVAGAATTQNDPVVSSPSATRATPTQSRSSH
jgi:hypothetical protein